MQKITTFLWFDNQAEEAVNYYASIFRDARTLTTTRYGKGAPMPEGTVLTVEFELFGQQFTALNGGPVFKFNESISLVIHCDTQEEIDYYWEKLSDGGQEQNCGWLKDRYGLSWQVVPADLPKLISHPDKEKTQRVMDELMKMIKLDVGILRKAYDGA